MIIAGQSLRAIDAITLARNTVRAAVDRLYSDAIHISMHMRLTLTYEDAPLDVEKLDPRATELGDAVYRLVRYAAHGEPLDANVHEYCVSLIRVGDEALDDSEATDPQTDLGRVVKAALAREALDAGKGVGYGLLAALGGTSYDVIKTLVSRGEISGKAGVVRAKAAITWLAR